MKRRGFTLIELMITVAVVAVLAAIAYPSYTSHIRKGKRATAQAALVDGMARQQAYLLDRRSYGTASDIGLAVPGDIASAYSISASAATGVITATPINAHAAAGELALSISPAGDKEPSSTSGYWGH